MFPIALLEMSLHPLQVNIVNIPTITSHLPQTESVAPTSHLPSICSTRVNNMSEHEADISSLFEMESDG